MKRLLSIIILLSITFFGFSQEKKQQESKPVGIGLRIGDFNGASFKYYLEDAGLCLEANIGVSYFSGDNYKKRFEQYAEKENIVFSKYDSKRTIEKGSFGYRFDIQKYGIIGNTPHLYWYAGTGFQARNFSIEHNYSFLFKPKNSSSERVNDSGKVTVKHSSYGVNLMLGGEYIFQEIPLSFFVDGLLFYEAFGLRNNIIWQLGMGTRFHF